MNPSFFKNNRSKLLEQVSDGVILLHSGMKKKVSTKENYQFRVNKMFYYVTGLSDPELILLIGIKNNHMQEMLFIPEDDPVRQRWEGKILSQKEARNKSLIESIYYKQDFNTKFNELFGQNENSKLWINEDDNQREEFNTYFNVPLNSSYSNVHPLLADMRVTKNNAEIGKLMQVIELGAKGIRNVISAAKEYMYEYELEAIFDFTLKSNGLKTGQYQTILASGKNATILHYTENNCRVKKDDLILIDIDVEKDHYHCDMTRVFPASGKFTERQKEIYNAVLSVQKEIISQVRPGVIYGTLNKLSKELLWAKCKELKLDTVTKKLENYYFHNIGHFIGLDTHDVGDMTEEGILAPGMVLTIEPGLYISEENIGIRIEDMIAVTVDGHVNLTKNLVKEIEDIENMIQNRKDDHNNDFQ